MAYFSNVLNEKIPSRIHSIEHVSVRANVRVLVCCLFNSLHLSINYTKCVFSSPHILRQKKTIREKTRESERARSVSTFADERAPLSAHCDSNRRNNNNNNNNKYFLYVLRLSFNRFTLFAPGFSFRYMEFLLRSHESLSIVCCCCCCDVFSLLSFNYSF